ncbi:MAG: C40 family peptidase [Ectothiorhodospiraceae bacterium]|nr:C40 family peptidase [Ectothiorhodospiraceae bacterium]MCH8506273.1 NlpC/P60 family protein [Ectothiorhodospiraceae bacterium]
MKSFLLVAAALALAGCATTPPSPTPPATERPSARSEPQRDGVIQALYTQHADWRGTPYRIGGTGRTGIDCSAFVMTTFRSQFGVDLPRTTEQQARFGDPIPREQMAAGDLVFFRTGAKKRHVGIYVENGRFLHASTSAGVTLSELDNPYWADSYWMTRRPRAQGALLTER